MESYLSPSTVCFSPAYSRDFRKCFTTAALQRKGFSVGGCYAGPWTPGKMLKICKNVSLHAAASIKIEVTWLTGIYENLLGHSWFALAKYTHSPVFLSSLFSLPWVKR